MEVEHVREVLTGARGPYADPRVAIDSLDNLEELVAQLDAPGRRQLAGHLTELVMDDDPIVATGAALGAAMVVEHLDPDELIATASRPDPHLDRAPLGFSRTTRSSLRGEVVVLACRCASEPHTHTVTDWLDHPPAGLDRCTLAMLLADRFADLLVANATRWLDGRCTGALIRLPSHGHRIALATALGRWDDRAVGNVRVGARLQGWSDGDTDALIAVMTAPPGVGPLPPGAGSGPTIAAC